jgi:PTS system fructose-specific IIC component
MTGDARVLDGEALHKAVLQREAMSSTGIGSGLAIPHVKIRQVTDFILAIGRCREGIAYEALDGQPVHLIFMLAASDQQTRPFIHVLARINEVMRASSAREALLDAQDRDSIFKLCQQYEW